MRWRCRKTLSFHSGAIHEKTVVFLVEGDFVTASEKKHLRRFF
jgi:hypothetical protein